MNKSYQPLTQKVLLIGWDTADWKVIHSMMDAGTQQGSVQQGSY